MPEQKLTYGIIGNPVKHSLSPVMHNTAFKALAVDAVYQLFPLEEDEVESFLKDVRKTNSPIFGLNVTVPYKEKVIPFLDALSPFAQKAMAVNTIVVEPDRHLTGHNTDGAGFLAHLAELQFDVKGKRIVVLGAGGTARSILTALCLLPERPESIHLYNRTHQKAKGLVADLGKRMDVGLVTVEASIDDLNIELADLLINTTSVGLHSDDPCLVDDSLIHSDMLVYDVIYRPALTPLLKLAQAAGAKTANGLGLLFYQGVLSFQHWSGMPLDTKIKQKMRRSLLTYA